MTKITLFISKNTNLIILQNLILIIFLLSQKVIYKFDMKIIEKQF